MLVQSIAKELYPLWGRLCALQVLDIESTRLALSVGGSEANPVMATVLGYHGFGGLYLVKIAGMGILGLCIRHGLFKSVGILKFMFWYYICVVLLNLCGPLML